MINSKRSGRKRFWSNLEFYPRIGLEELTKTKMILRAVGVPGPILEYCINVSPRLSQLHPSRSVKPAFKQQAHQRFVVALLTTLPSQGTNE